METGKCLEAMEDGAPMALLATDKVFFVIDLKPTGKLSLAQAPDGRLVVLRDGQPLPGQQWQADHVEQAVDGFLRIASVLRQLEGADR